MIVAMDIGSFHRVGPVQDWVRPETDVVVIDHHPGSTGPDRPCRRLDLVDPSVASTTMLLYQLLQVAYPGSIDAGVATCLYIGLITDTGCFRHSNTNAAVLGVAHELATLGADAGSLPEAYMFRRRPQALLLLAAVLGSIQFAADDRFASMLLTQEMLRRTGGREDETEGFVNYASSLDGVRAAALLRETASGETRVSLRSSGFVDVGQLAHEFGGGGHRNAAGCTLQSDLETARRSITAAALRHLDVHQAAAEGA
jgi:phosphoesterase RecJ-like protein